MGSAGEGHASGALEAVLAAVARRRRLQAALSRVLEERGYAEIAVPLLQPAVQGEATGEWGPAYRVLDQDGEVLELRPDVTGPVARLCAKGDAAGPRPRRLYYQASIFRRLPGGRPREIAQAGAERIGGGDSVAERAEADAEMLTLAAECLREAGARGFLLVLGNAAYVRERLQGCGAAVAPAEAALRARDRVGLAAVVDAAVAEGFAWRGGLGAALAGGLVGAGVAAREWRGLLGRLQRAGMEGVVLVEPGLLLPGTYYTGAVFEVLVPGVPWPVGDGGRYDGLLGRWGDPEPAVGFALDCDRLLRAVDGEAPSEGTHRAWAAVRDAGPAQGANGR